MSFLKWLFGKKKKKEKPYRSYRTAGYSKNESNDGFPDPWFNSWLNQTAPTDSNNDSFSGYGGGSSGGGGASGSWGDSGSSSDSSDSGSSSSDSGGDGGSSD